MNASSSNDESNEHSTDFPWGASTFAYSHEWTASDWTFVLMIVVFKLINYFFFDVQILWAERPGRPARVNVRLNSHQDTEGEDVTEVPQSGKVRHWRSMWKWRIFTKYRYFLWQRCIYNQIKGTQAQRAPLGIHLLIQLKQNRKCQMFFGKWCPDVNCKICLLNCYLYNSLCGHCCWYPSPSY